MPVHPLNAPAPTVKATPPSAVTVSGISIPVRFIHPLKALSPIALSLLPASNVTFFRLLPPNALPSIVSMDDGIVILSILLYANRYAGIFLRLLLNVTTVFAFPASWKVNSPEVYAVSSVEGISILSNPEHL